ncbi:guanylate kinase [Batrachochytrium salamandrivorans]|nr:guanylate kinase [Batrachochytrium salamandrivorans]
MRTVRVRKINAAKRLFAEYPDNFGFSISHTSRQPRAGESDGVEYHFCERESLKSLISQGMFIESAEFSGNIYGTSYISGAASLDKGKNVILDIDMQGVVQLQARVREGTLPFASKFLYIFIAPPTMDVLRERLTGRGTETEEFGSW